MNQRIGLLSKKDQDATNLLRAFCTKHRPTLTFAASCALDLHDDPSKALTHVARVHVYSRKASKRTETAFYAVEIKASPIDDFPKEMADELRMQMDASRGKWVSGSDGDGLFYVIVECVDGGEDSNPVSNAIGCVFWQQIAKEEYVENWKELSLKYINEGIVL